MRARGFGMRILYTARLEKPDFEADIGATWRTLDDLLVESDIVTLHVPSHGETRGLINSDRILQMKRGSMLIKRRGATSWRSLP